MQSDLRRGDRYPDQLRNSRVREALDLLEHENGTQARRKIGNGLPKVDGRFMIRRRSADSVFERGCCAQFIAAHATERDADRYTLQPTDQRAAVLVPSQRF